jgi:hypothetical protein
MDIIIKVELDRLAMEKFEEKLEREAQEFMQHDDFYRWQDERELLDWQEWQASKFANLLGN